MISHRLIHLPQCGKRFYARDKANIIEAIRAGQDAVNICARYRISAEELAEWRRRYDRNGLSGLKATRQERRGT